ncbi:MAG: ATP-binding cassette domain-containing protein [Rubrivivax sp.]|nr:ATP-binding cassette domain-containing protein [Rubrivivax sp.]
MAAIQFRDVIKRYGSGAGALQVIHGVDAEIADGEFVVIVGPSGCGKSTLLRMVAGLEAISGGTISIGGRVVNDVDPSERDIAMVFQNYALYPHFNVFDNMAYGLRIRKLPPAEVKARVEKAAATLELSHLLDRKPRQLSGGQRQRVAMGRAIVRSPQVFLFDEPTSLFVTHDQVEAMTLAERMIVMNAGRIEQIGTPEQVYAQPSSTFVAGFIGSPPMNLLAGEAHGASLRIGGTELPLPAPAPRDGALTLGLRPEHALPADGGWPLAVEMVEMLGAERLVHGRVAGLPFTWRIDGTLVPPRPGDTVAIGPATGRLHWFGGDGRRVG